MFKLWGPGHLPSPRYFDEVADPVVTFDINASFVQPWIAFWGSLINVYPEFTQFLTGTGVHRDHPSAQTLRLPEVLDPDLLADATALHNELDSYDIPDHIRVVQVAGWGRPTTKAVEYTTNHFLQSYKTVPTVEGDGTVVYPSAVLSDGAESYFFNLSLFNQRESRDVQHRNLLEADSIQNLIKDVIESEPVTTTAYISQVKPPLTEVGTQLLVSTHSPVILGAYDALGNFTGVDPDQDLSADILSVSEHIPGSAFLYTGESQQIFLPKDGIYHFVYEGIGDGPTSVTIDTISDDTITPVASYSDIPTTANTSAAFTIDSATPEETVIEVDADGDAQADDTVHPDGTHSSLSELIAEIKETIGALDATVKLKQNLLKRIDNLERKIESKKERNAKALANLKQKISKQELKGRIDAASAAEITALIERLEAQAEDVTPDADVLADLKEAILALDVKASLKSELLRRVDRLENIRVLTTALATLEENISRKATNGGIIDIDAQVLLVLLGQVENAL